MAFSRCHPLPITLYDSHTRTRTRCGDLYANLDALTRGLASYEDRFGDLHPQDVVHGRPETNGRARRGYNEDVAKEDASGWEAFTFDLRGGEYEAGENLVVPLSRDHLLQRFVVEAHATMSL